MSPCASCGLPGNSAGSTIVPLFGLTPGGACPATGCCHPRGALLPHHFTLTGLSDMNQIDLGGVFSVALSIGSRRPGVTWHPALRSPDFPPLDHTNVVGQRLSGQLQGSLYQSPVINSENLCSGKQESDGELHARLFHGAVTGPILNPTEIRGRPDSLRVTSSRISGAKKINMPA